MEDPAAAVRVRHARPVLASTTIASALADARTHDLPSTSQARSHPTWGYDACGHARWIQ